MRSINNLVKQSFRNNLFCKKTITDFKAVIDYQKHNQVIVHNKPEQMNSRTVNWNQG